MQQNSQLSDIIAKYPSDQIFVLLDSNLSTSLPYPNLSVSAVEANKTLQTVQTIWDFLLEHHATRHALLINIGGGVITDLGGFAAATYKRGIDYVNIPTTLLAMVDAAHGGKTGVNYGGLKNQIGVFRQPVATIINPDFLTTLDTRTFLSGYAELLKTALLDSNDFLSQAISFLEDYVSSNDFSALPTGVIRQLISRAVSIKQRIVAADPTETGLRKALNLGHTIGHTLEALNILIGEAGLTASGASQGSLKWGDRKLSYSASGLLHGYAVLYGLVAELYLSRLLLPDFDDNLLRQLSRILIDVYGKPTCSCRDYDRLIELMRSDKKNTSADAINFTLLRKAGDPVIDRVATPSQIREALEYLFNL